MYYVLGGRFARSQRGFTLVELLVVISIIALLLSIMMPTLKSARESAKAVLCQSNQRQVGLMLMIYAEDYDGFYPRARGVGDLTGWIGPLISLSGGESSLSEKTFVCPSDQLKRNLARVELAKEQGYSGNKRSYSQNHVIYKRDKTIDTASKIPRIETIKRPSEFFLMGEQYSVTSVIGSNEYYTMRGSSNAARAHKKDTTCFYILGDGSLTSETVRSPRPGESGSNWDEWRDIYWGSRYWYLHWRGR